jgi:hypothetical protein
MKKLTQLKVSDFGKTIRYIPLETTDDGLVGDRPVIKVLKEYIVVENSVQENCLLFDKKDGHFIAEIGSCGQAPMEFSANYSWTDEKEAFLYFERQPNQLIKFDMKGNFCGNITFSSPGETAFNYFLTDSLIIGYFQGFGPFALGIYDKQGNLLDSVPQFFPRTLPDLTKQPAKYEMLWEYNQIGSLSNGSGVIILYYRNDELQFFVRDATSSRIWENNGNIRFKEVFSDTIYTFSDNQFIPSILFNTGKYHWPAQNFTTQRNTNNRILITDVFENNTFIFFQCIKDLISDEPVLYNGLYNKQTGETKLSKNSEGITDDLNHFMPFTPLGISTSGEFFSLIKVGKMLEWLEKHPEANQNENLSFLKALDEEMNPIVMLIE